MRCLSGDVDQVVRPAKVVFGEGNDSETFIINNNT